MMHTLTPTADPATNVDDVARLVSPTASASPTGTSIRGSRTSTPKRCAGCTAT